MKILALDAALGGFSAALDVDGAVRVDASGKQDALEHGLARVAALLERAGLRLADLDRIAVGLGPGSFTGVRIAVSYAKSLAYGSGRPLVGISSYDALEPEAPPLPVLTVVSGRRGVVCARLRTADGATTACGPTAQVLARVLHGKTGLVHLAGNTEDVLPEITRLGLTVRALPSRADIAAVAIAELARTAAPAASPHALAPDYGEAPATTQPGTPW